MRACKEGVGGGDGLELPPARVARKRRPVRAPADESSLSLSLHRDHSNSLSLSCTLSLQLLSRSASTSLYLYLSTTLHPLAVSPRSASTSLPLTASTSLPLPLYHLLAVSPRVSLLWFPRLYTSLPAPARYPTAVIRAHAYTRARTSSLYARRGSRRSLSGSATHSLIAH